MANKMEYACATHRGKVREENQDNFYIDGKVAKSEECIFAGVFGCPENIIAVCDGMGGESNGAEAARIAAERIRQADAALRKKTNTDTYALITGHIGMAHEDVRAMRDRTGKRSGSTINAVYTDGEKIRSYNLGDSRTYIFRDNALEQLSYDHTAAADLFRMKAISEKEMRLHPCRNQLYKYVGTKNPPPEPHIREEKLREGDIILLCSDGLTDMCVHSEIVQSLAVCRSLKGTTAELVEKALDNGGSDNITVILMRGI